MATSKKIMLGIADDHSLLRKGLVKLLQTYGNYQFLFDVDSGTEVIEQMKQKKIPDVLILDVNMPDKDGPATAEWVTQHYPFVKILVLSMYNDENTILKMVHAGASGYVTKNSDPEKLKEAIDAVYERGIYIPEAVSAKLISGIQQSPKPDEKALVITPREKEFLTLLCKEMTYPQIAEQMFLSPRTIEGYRKSLSRKLKVKGKAGLIMYAMSNGFK